MFVKKIKKRKKGSSQTVSKRISTWNFAKLFFGPFCEFLSFSFLKKFGIFVLFYASMLVFIFYFCLFYLLLKKNGSYFRWDICMLTSEKETWIVTHMDHVHIAPILIIVLVIVHLGENSVVFHMSKWTTISPAQGLNQIPIFTTRTGATILISHGKLKP
jgi:hypothetical protein